jgi:hypothetical protein
VEQHGAVDEAIPLADVLHLVKTLSVVGDKLSELLVVAEQLGVSGFLQHCKSPVDKVSPTSITKYRGYSKG